MLFQWQFFCAIKRRHTALSNKKNLIINILSCSDIGARSEQGCQMVYFQIKNTNLCSYRMALNMLVYFMAIWNLWQPFGISYPAIWYILWSIGISFPILV
jgi:hypothetical protein